MMRNLPFLLEKEFKQIFRNPTILKMIIAMPIIQLIVIPFAADYEVKNINITIVDQDHSTYSQRLTQKIDASSYFQLQPSKQSYDEGAKEIEKGKTDLILTIPPHFERKIVRENKATLYLAADAVNGVKAGLGTGYASRIIMEFNNQIRQEWMPGPLPTNLPQIKIESAQWYNPHSDYHWFMVPGILAILVTMVGSFLASLNIVAEKEIGTIEQINVTPVKKIEFILGKLIPFWILGLISIAIGMGVGLLIYGLWPIGSVIDIFIYSAIYLIAVLGIGLLVSTFADNQQQATLFAFFFMMIFILMGGLYTPIESMPNWAQVVAKLNPPMYFIKGIRAIYLKGSGLFDLRKDLMITAGFAVFFNVLAVLNYSKRTS